MNNYEAYTAVKNAMAVTKADPTKSNWLVIAIVGAVVLIGVGVGVFFLVRRRK